MQRISIILYSLMLAISFTACNAGGTQPSTTTPSTASLSPITQDYTTVGSTIVSCTSSTSPKKGDNKAKPPAPENTTETEVPKEEVVQSMQVTVGNKTFSAALAENEAASAFVGLMQKAPVVINMSDYSGFEKVGSLGTSLPTDNSSITANKGDIILYNGNQIVAFYGSNSWSYTRLGKIEDLSGWKEALGDGDITITFSIE